MSISAQPAQRTITARTGVLHSLSCSISEAAGRIRTLEGLSTFMMIEGIFADKRAYKVIAAGEIMSFEGREAQSRICWADGRSMEYSCIQDPLEQLFPLSRLWEIKGTPLPDVLKGVFGFIAYDAVRRFEHLPDKHQRSGTLPDYYLYLPKVFVLFGEDEVRLIVLSLEGEAQQDDEQLYTELRHILELPKGVDSCQRPLPEEMYGIYPQKSFTKDQFSSAVEQAKEYIVNGDIFQVVLSVQMCFPSMKPDPIAIYNSLSKLNPSPFQYCFIHPDFQVVGASPEPLVLVHEGHGELRPLAGTAPRGCSGEEDGQNEQRLLDSEKDKAEHRMLVDLARNDLGRISGAGTVTVKKCMEIERYSHVMHLVSDVHGVLKPAIRMGDVLRSCFPAGTMAGAPKIRAMEIIEELEPAARRLYSGGVGVMSDEAMSLYLTIRSLILHDGGASLQAGAGIVYDSDPEFEYAECMNKLKAGLSAIGFDEVMIRDICFG